MSCTAPNCNVECDLCIAAKRRELNALLARAEKAEAAVQEWREWGDKAAKRNWNEGTPALALVLDERPDSTAGSDLLDRLRKAEGAVSKLAGQLPREMHGCTIQLIQCPSGHSRLTAANWIDHGCGTCERDALRAENERLRGEAQARDMLYQFKQGHMVAMPCKPVDGPTYCGQHGHRLPCGECMPPAFDPAARPIWEIAAEIGAKVPLEVWAKAFPDKVAPRRSLWPLALAAVAAWTFIALQRGWFAQAWAWVVEVMG